MTIFPTNSKNRRAVEHWTTVAMMPAPAGLVNRATYDDGSETIYPCPALLLEEWRVTTYGWEGPDGETYTREVPNDAPYETRVVPGEFSDGQIGPQEHISNVVTEWSAGVIVDIPAREPAKS